MRSVLGPLGLAAIGVVPVPAFGQTVEFFGVSKEQDHVQHSESAVEPAPVLPFYFGAGVFGTDLASIEPPSVTGPINHAEPWHNAGVLGYNIADGSWEYGWPEFGGWQTQTRAELDAMFGNGVYSFEVLGTLSSVSLVGDAYPSSTPVLTLVGGVWAGGRYVLPLGADLTITSSSYAEYGTHDEDVIHLNTYGPGYDGDDEVLQFASQVAEPWVSAVYPASSLVGGGEYEINVGFGAVVDFNTDIPGLAGAIQFASYEKSTSVFVRVSDRPGCSPADLAEPYAILDLADVLAFVAGFGALDPTSDLAEPLGVFDLADVLAFVALFSEGCP